MHPEMNNNGKKYAHTLSNLQAAAELSRGKNKPQYFLFFTYEPPYKGWCIDQLSLLHNDLLVAKDYSKNKLKNLNLFIFNENMPQ